MFKNIKRKIVSITAMVCMLTTVLFGNVNVSAEVLHLEESGYFSYEINNDEAMITFYQLGTTDDTLTIPNQINGYTVVEISEKAFFMQPTIKEVIIPESVRNIGVQAFGYVQDEETYKKINGFTIKGYTGTAAEVYAEDNGFTFVAVDEEPVVTTAVTTIAIETTTTTVSTTVSETTTVTTETVKISGDANSDNKLDVRDCTYIANMLASGTGYKLPKTADFNGDGIVNVRDAAAIAKKLAEKNL